MKEGLDQPGDDWIQRLWQESSERERVEQRRDQIETRFLFVFLWFFISFWSLGIYELVFADAHVTLRTTRGTLEVMGATVFGLLVTWIPFPVLNKLFPRGEPGLLAWLDTRREERR